MLVQAKEYCNFSKLWVNKCGYIYIKITKLSSKK